MSLPRRVSTPCIWNAAFGLGPGQIGALAFAAGLLANAGYYQGGWLSDRLSTRDVSWALRMPPIFLLCYLVIALHYYNV